MELCGLDQGNWLFSGQAPTRVYILSFQASHGLNTVMLRHDEPPAEAPGQPARVLFRHFSPFLATLCGTPAVCPGSCLITLHQNQLVTISLPAYSLKHAEMLRFPSVDKDTGEHLDVDKYIFVR